MSLRHVLVGCPALFIFACAPESPAPGDHDGRAERAERSEHEVVPGHCSVAACGGQSLTDACWCDELCEYYGDCCIDEPFFCPALGEQCGGFAGTPCAEGFCADDPSDDCDPQSGGADCGGVCVDEPPCTTDDDCAEGWCRPVQAGGSSCAPWAQLDEACAGHVPAWSFERCAPGLVCYQTGEGAYDIPGTCRPFCGGIDGILCEAGSHCVLDGNYPDAGGHCEETRSDSCQDHCNGPSEDGSCWCDDLCSGYGDCCSDFDAHCV